MRNTLEIVKRFKDRYHGATLSNRPNWIRAEFKEELHPEVYHLVFDFKSDQARKDFGGLCACLYTSCENWTITTKRASMPI